MIDVSAIIDSLENNKRDGAIVCDRTELESAIKNNLNGKKKRQPCCYIKWLKENNSNIRNTYFSDFEDVTDWGYKSKVEYYKSKSIPIDKIKGDGKPKIITLITAKAGILWKSLSDEEKNKYNSLEHTSVKTNVNKKKDDNKPKKKRGRPKKNQEVVNIPDSVIEEYKNNVEEVTEISGRPFYHKDKEYFLEDNGNIWNIESQTVVGKKNGNDVVFI